MSKYSNIYDVNEWSEEAKVKKEHKLCVTHKRVLEDLKQRGVLVPPKTKVAQNALLLELMLKEINSEGKV